MKKSKKRYKTASAEKENIVLKPVPAYDSKNVCDKIYQKIWAILKFHKDADKHTSLLRLLVIEPSGDEFVSIKKIKSFEPKKW